MNSVTVNSFHEIAGESRNQISAVELELIENDSLNTTLIQEDQVPLTNAASTSVEDTNGNDVTVENTAGNYFINFNFDKNSVVFVADSGASDHIIVSQKGLENFTPIPETIRSANKNSYTNFEIVGDRLRSYTFQC